MKILTTNPIKLMMATGGPMPKLDSLPVVKKLSLEKQRKDFNLVRNTFRGGTPAETYEQARRDEYMIQLMGLTDEHYLNKTTPMDLKELEKRTKYDWAKESKYLNLADEKRQEILDFKGAAFPKPPTDSETFVNTYEMTKYHPMLQNINAEQYTVSPEERRDPKNYAALIRFDEHLYNQQKQFNETQEEFFNRRGKDTVEKIKNKLVPIDFTTKLLNTLTGGK